PTVVRRVVVQNDYLVLAPVRLERSVVATAWRAGLHIHLEDARVPEDSLQVRSGFLPVIVRTSLLSVENHDVNRDSGLQGESQRSDCSQHQADQTVLLHGASLSPPEC